MPASGLSDLETPVMREGGGLSFLGQWLKLLQHSCRTKTVLCLSRPHEGLVSWKSSLLPHSPQTYSLTCLTQGLCLC